MKRILCLIDSLGPGGAQRQLAGLASFLKRDGYDVIVACYHDDRFYVDRLLSNGVPYVYLNKAKNSSFRIWQVTRYICKIKPNVVIAFLETPSICSCISHAFNRKYRLIVSERNTTQHTGLYEKIRFNLFRLADYVVPNAFAQEKYIKEVFPFLINRVITIPNFVDLSYFVPLSKKEYRKVPEIVVAASIWRSKNTFGFIDAVAKLKNMGLQFHVSWYGKVPSHIDYFEQCQQKINELGICDYIELKEKTQQIRDKYQNADYFCLPSFYEGTPNVVCEAMSCGLPIACSDVCDNSIYVKEGENGFLFNPSSIESIVDAIKRMLSLSRTDYIKYSTNSRTRAEVLLSEAKFVKSYVDIIEQ